MENDKQQAQDQSFTTITVRLTFAEKKRIIRAMEEEGFDNISPFVIWVIRKFIKRNFL